MLKEVEILPSAKQQSLVHSPCLLFSTSHLFLFRMVLKLSKLGSIIEFYIMIILFVKSYSFSLVLNKE